NPASKSTVASSPVSRPVTSARASWSWRKTSRSVSGARPSCTQKAANASKMFVVRTPPKSVTRPRRSSAGTRDLPGELGELRDAVPERGEEGIVRRAGQIAPVGALEEDRALPEREHLVPVQARDGTTGAPLVARDELRSGRKARDGRHGRL